MGFDFLNPFGGGGTSSSNTADQRAVGAQGGGGSTVTLGAFQTGAATANTTPDNRTVPVLTQNFNNQKNGGGSLNDLSHTGAADVGGSIGGPNNQTAGGQAGNVAVSIHADTTTNNSLDASVATSAINALATTAANAFGAAVALTTAAQPSVVIDHGSYSSGGGGGGGGTGPTPVVMPAADTTTATGFAGMTPSTQWVLVGGAVLLVALLLFKK